MAKYKVRLDCEVAGRWRTTTEELELSDVAAKHLLPPYGNVLVPVDDPAKVAATVSRKATAKAADDNG
ncbi:MAG: hypothetical protein H6R00_175 [Proteobacteria bacterium]|nr:hypothetical protein [Pseudomonadota bacterium]